MDRIEFFLETILPICWKGQWLTIDEMMELTKLHPSVVRWCLRQCKTGEEGDFIIRKRRRPQPGCELEIYIKRKPAQLRLPFYENAGTSA
jgi:hypothetical protein